MIGRPPRIALLIVVLLGVAAAQMPVPEFPTGITPSGTAYSGTVVDTTYSLPAGGTAWTAHTAAQLTTDLDSAQPGDVIALDVGVVYSGNFTLPAKSNPNKKWIYIVGSALASLPSPGTRVNPATDAANMPKIVTPNSAAALTVFAGANHYRLVGLEVYSASTQLCYPKNIPPANCASYQLLNANWSTGQTLADSITVDRCYLHGSPTQDITRAIAGNISNLAVVDSYISDIHGYGVDSQAIGLWYSPGPIKIINNYLEAAGENVMFGGAGGLNNPFIPSDIEIRNNYFYKPLSWQQVGVTIPPNNPWVVKNHLEFKSARRALVDGNVMENSWVSGQIGFGVLLTVRTSQSGNIAVVDDITISNNILKNVVSGFQTGAHDSECPKTPGCTNSGEARRIKIFNNLVLFHNPSGPGSTNGQIYFGVIFSKEATDMVVQHNTFVSYQGTNCTQSIYFSLPGGSRWPPPTPPTHNVWILDNVLCRQPTGDYQKQGTAGLSVYMGDPAPWAPRYFGNVMYAPAGDQAQSFPPGNRATSEVLRYVDPLNGNYQLLTPNLRTTSDGTAPGINSATFQTMLATRP
ncbi:MAG: hypothetical protein WBS19_15545 [Candidatus Korobacteraceae bacterium]